jgi:hypothetical protein
MSPRADSTSNKTVRLGDDATSAPTGRADSKVEIDAELQCVLETWPALPAALKAGIMAMIDAARK